MKDDATRSQLPNEGPDQTQQVEDERITSDIEARRTLMELVAVGDYDTLPLDEFEQSKLSIVLEAICCELIKTTIEVEQEIRPALDVVAALTGGLFGAETTHEDETIVALHKQAERVRFRIQSQVGWPKPGLTLEEDIAEEAAYRAKRKAESDAWDAKMAANREKLNATQARIDEQLKGIDTQETA